jgi:hypothetical protein
MASQNFLYFTAVYLLHFPDRGYVTWCVSINIICIERLFSEHVIPFTTDDLHAVLYTIMTACVCQV